MAAHRINLICLADDDVKISGTDKLRQNTDVVGRSMLERVTGNIYNTGINFTFCFLQEHEDKFNISKPVRKYIPDANFVFLPKATDGSAISALAAAQYINDDPLIIVNCAQIIEDLNWKKLLTYALEYDGVVGISDSVTETDKADLIINDEETIKVNSLAGVYFWASGEIFLESTKEMIDKNDSVNGQFCLLSSYKYLIDKGLKIGAYKFNKYFSLRDKESLDIYRKYFFDRYLTAEKKKREKLVDITPILKKHRTSIYGLNFLPSLEPKFPDDRDSCITSELSLFHNLSIRYFQTEEVTERAYNKVVEIIESYKRDIFILEIGVNRSKERQFTDAFIKYKSKKSLYIGIDINDKSSLNDKENNVWTIKTDSRNQDYIRSKFDWRNIDILMIDGDHSVVGAVNDFKYANILADDGTVILHDSNSHSGPLALIEAIDRDIFTVEKLFEENLDDFGLTIIKKRPNNYVKC